MRIAGSRVLLTGATGGIGHAIARVLHARGAELVLTGRRTELLEPLVAELTGSSAIAADLTDPAEVDRLAREAGHVDILVANAALAGTGRLDSFTMAQIDRALNVNLRAPIALAHALSPAMIARHRGHLVFIGSLNSKAATPQTCIYNATKFGLRGFAAALRADLARNGVGVSSIFPGFIRDAGLFADSGASLPPGVRTRSPEDVARAVADAVERDRGEVDVAPLSLRVGTAFAGLAPGLANSLSRRMGAEKIAAELAAGNVGKR
ncbi:MAG TPA: SDR family NAD(P)-dependent oxidoreductase [Solirubrobacteraceae bacterium]|nr:SDR family NAD(P)-dependent oxidoreductase [Solirubrobacteraceae bacterium]